jgi:hypothetical protein
MTYLPGISQPLNPKQSFLCQKGIIGWNFYLPSNSEVVKSKIKKLFFKGLGQNNWKIPCYGYFENILHPNKYRVWVSLQNAKHFQKFLKGRVLGIWGYKFCIVDFETFTLFLPIDDQFSKEKWKSFYGHTLIFKLSKKKRFSNNWVVEYVDCINDNSQKRKNNKKKIVKNNISATPLEKF